MIVPGERPRGEMARKGSAGRTRSKFFPNGWTNQNQERDLNQTYNGQSEAMNQLTNQNVESVQSVTRSSGSPRESRSEPANQKASRVNKSVPSTPDNGMTHKTQMDKTDGRPSTPNGPKNENDLLSSSLPSSFFHKSKFFSLIQNQFQLISEKETSIMRKPTIPKSAQENFSRLILIGQY